MGIAEMCKGEGWGYGGIGWGAYLPDIRDSSGQGFAQEIQMCNKFFGLRSTDKGDPYLLKPDRPRVVGVPVASPPLATGMLMPVVLITLTKFYRDTSAAYTVIKLGIVTGQKTMVPNAKGKIKHNVSIYMLQCLGLGLGFPVWKPRLLQNGSH